MGKAVTIKDIAEALKLSRNTVSKALNGQNVPNKTRELVFKKARELNYKSFDSELLKSKKYRILLLSGKPFHNMSFFVPLVNSIETYCYDNNYDFFEYTYNSETTSFGKIKAYINSLQVDGIVAIECFDDKLVNNLLSMNIPMCFIDFPGYKFDPISRFDLICSSDQKSVCEYVKTLIAQHNLRRFTFVGDFRHCLSFHERYMGMLRGLTRTNTPHELDEDIVKTDGVFDYGDIHALKNEILKLRHLPECFVCCNDFVARRVIKALKELGHEIPKDTMVVGFDDTSDATNDSPTLTTFFVDKANLGRGAIKVLINRIERKDCPTTTIMIDTELVIRESTSNK